MYGEPLNPKKTAFAIVIDPSTWLYVPTLFLEDLEDPDNDDVREVNHPDFETYWGNSMENTFEACPQRYVNKINPKLKASLQLKKLANGAYQLV